MTSNVQKTTVLTRTIGSVTQGGPGTKASILGELSAEISPCSWMYQNYPFQIRVDLKNGGSAYLIDKTFHFENATVEAMQNMLDKVAIQKCKCRGCNNAAFDPETVETNRDGKCEACFMKKLNQSFEKAMRKEEEKLAKQDAKHKAAGMTHRVDAWIHAGGDDKQLSIWTNDPSEKMIRHYLQKAGSRVLDDYKVIPL